MYSKKQFGIELKKQLDLGFDVVRIARWAHHNIYLKHCLEMESKLKDLIMQIIAMEEGPEFEFSEQELVKIAEDFMCT